MLARKRLTPCGDQSFLGFNLAGLRVWALVRTCLVFYPIEVPDFVSPDTLRPGPPVEAISAVEPLLWPTEADAEESCISGCSSMGGDYFLSLALNDGSVRFWQTSSFVLLAVNYYFSGPLFIGDKSFTAWVTDCEVMTSRLGVSSLLRLLFCWFYEV